MAKLAVIRSIGLPAGLFADIAPRVLAGWRDRAAMESPGHLREDHSPEIKLTLLASLLYGERYKPWEAMRRVADRRGWLRACG